MSILRAPIRGLICLALCGCDSIPVRNLPQYRVTQDVYVRDESALCRQAWDVALRRFGPRVAEAVTMTGGQFEPTKCLAVVIQTAEIRGVDSAGINVVMEDL